MSDQQTVFVGLSGGVDSSVAAKRLLEQGYSVVGVFIKVWHPEFLVCNWEQERLDAMRVAAHLGIPFLTCDGEVAYRDRVAEHFIREYAAGRTPNPDVLCNQFVKFGVFQEFARAHGADYIATGHYVRRQDVDNTPRLLRGVDENKDQSYFLWALTREQLAYSLFPVGDTNKKAIRAEAAAAGIPTAQKHDSQGICFLGHIDIPEFLSHYVDLSPGTVLDEQGKRIGTHQGALTYTLGQRHGFTITTNDPERSPRFVIGKNLEQNTVIVGATAPRLEPEATVPLTDTILRREPEHEEALLAQFRYRQPPFPISLERSESGEWKVRPHDQIDRPAHGQSCVLYVGSECIGGGTIG